jgi:hypothetical protein
MRGFASAAVLLGSLIVGGGCGGADRPATIPETLIELPKQGPVPAGVPGGKGIESKSKSSNAD